MTSVWSICAKLLCATLLLSSCSSNGGFETLPSGSKWRLLSFGDQAISVDSSAVVTFDLKVVNVRNGDTLTNGASVSFETGKDQLWKVIRGQYLGDSLTYVSVERDFLHPGQYRYDTLQYFIRIASMRTKRQLEDIRIVELTQLAAITETDSILEYYDEVEGVYIRKMVASLGRGVEEGREVVIHYRGYDLSGKLFDDTRMRNQPLRFVMGNENQVIPGLEIALEMMRKGESARILIPSWLAFGARGSGAGIIEPYQSLVYELEVVDVSEF